MFNSLTDPTDNAKDPSAPRAVSKTKRRTDKEEDNYEPTYQYIRRQRCKEKNDWSMGAWSPE